MRLRPTEAAVILSALVASCGGKTGAAADAGSPAHDGTSAVASGCPSSEPSGACSAEGLACEYGNDPDVRCDTLTTCTAGMWVGMRTSDGCDTTNPPGCPATYDAIPQ